MKNLTSLSKITNISLFYRQHTQSFRVVVIIVLLLMVIFAYKFLTKPSAKPQEITKMVEIVTLKPQDIQETISLIGTIKPQHSTVLFAKAAGRLDLIARAGERLKKGDLIAKIDDVDRAKTYELSEISEKIAKSQYERIARLLKSGHVSAREVEEKKAAWIEMQKASTDIKIELDKSQFYAPFDGVVGVFKVREGAYVNEGTPIGVFYDPALLTVEFDIPAAAIQHIHAAQPVKVNGKQYALTHAQHMIDEDTHMAPAYVDIVCEDCVIGTTVKVELGARHRKQALVVPFDAVFPQKDQVFVYTLTEGKATLKPVKLGIRDKNQIEIQSGLQPGDQVVAKNPQRLYPGVSVKVYQPQGVKPPSKPSISK